MSEIKPLTLTADASAVADLRERLSKTRWPEPETVEDWSQGLPLDYTQQLADYWRTEYDWTDRLAKLAAFDHFTTEIDGLDIHFLHKKSAEPGARPLILTHGWPGSVFEFLEIIDPLVDPVSHGGRAEDAFHVICPSLPGFGFSGKPTETGWGVMKIAAAWNTLMDRLGYERYFAQGGDWGAVVTAALGYQNLGQCAGLHLNMLVAVPPPEFFANPSPEDQEALIAAQYHQDQGMAYANQQRTRPQTMGYGLADSPVAQLSWIVEKFWAWTDNDGDPESAISRDEMLDTVTLYWMTGSGSSSAKLYWESFGNPFEGADLSIKIPVGYSKFPKEIVPAPKSWAEPFFEDLVYYGEPEKGGHFPALEQPDLFVREVRSCFGEMSL